MASFTWVVQITVAETWVADGFELDERRMHDIMLNALPDAYPHEVAVKIQRGPKPERILKAQGYDVEGDLPKDVESPG